jgi:hypothetical protein
VYVSTDPAGANLFCDSVSQGTTPATILVTRGKHIINVRKAGYRENRTGITATSGEKQAVEFTLEPIKGLILVHSQPSGAEVEIDGASIGKTPFFCHEVLPGERRLQVSMPGYMSKTINLNIEDRTPVKVDVTLSSDSAELTVESTPSGASVNMDGSVAGTTPLTLPNVKSGNHVLELSLKGHNNNRHEITLQTGEKQKVSSVLKALPGKLSVLSVPAGARIYLNNQFKSEAPIKSVEIPSGSYEIRAEAKGFDPQTKTNTISFGEETVVEFNLVKSSGTLLISTIPPGISVYVDGELRGVTKAHGNDQVSEQLQLDFIPKGQHTLQFTRQGFYNIQRTVDIMPKQTVILHEKLGMRPVPFIPNIIIRTGDLPEQTYRGVIIEKYANGDMKVEVEKGIFKTFRKSEIVSMEAIPLDGGTK